MNRLFCLTKRTINLKRSLTCYDQRLLRNTAFAPISNLRTFKSNNFEQQQNTSNSQTEKVTNNATYAKKKSKASPKITLIGQNQSITVTSLEEAQKLAKRRDLHLLLDQELDTKTQRPVYKLVTQSELLAEELNDLKTDDKSSQFKTATKKSEKTLTIGSRISDHDLASRQKNICKWLAKQHEVRILIQGGADDMPKMEKICKSIEQSIKEPQLVGKIQQKRVKGSHIKFNIVPVANSVSVQTDDASPAYITGTVKTKPTAA